MTDPRVTALSQYLSRVKSLRSRAKDLWYRGIKDSSLSLSPGLYWRGFSAEWDLTSGFLAQAPQFLTETQLVKFGGELEAPWEWYFLMQHYGIPTRLLDWTESPLVGLYFALKEFEESKAPRTTPCVWVLEPNQLNKKSIRFEGTLVPGGKFSQYWLYQTDPDDDQRCNPGKPVDFEYKGKSYSNELPMAIYPVRSNPRILAQQGVFTVHGASTSPLNEILAVDDRSSARGLVPLQMIEIEPSSAPSIRRELELLQVHELALFPELPVLAGRLLERALRELRGESS